MSPDEYLLIATTLALVTFIVALTSSKPPPKAKESPREVTRWKRFRILPSAMAESQAQPVTVAEEEPDGLRIELRPGRSHRGFQAQSGDGGRRIDVARRWSIGSRRHQVSVDGAALCFVAIPKRSPWKLSIEAVSPGEDLSLRGSPGDREYEILRHGKLAAIVSWQQEPEEDERERSHYVLEAEKSADAMPLLALALAVEHALG